MNGQKEKKSSTGVIRQGWNVPISVIDYTSCGTTSQVDGENIIFKNIVTLRPIGAKTVKPHLVGEEYGSYFVNCKIPRNVNMSTEVLNITVRDSVTARTST